MTLSKDDEDLLIMGAKAWLYGHAIAGGIAVLAFMGLGLYVLFQKVFG